LSGHLGFQRRQIGLLAHPILVKLPLAAAASASMRARYASMFAKLPWR
jgi:hypothetical protein